MKSWQSLLQPLARPELTFVVTDEEMLGIGAVFS